MGQVWLEMIKSDVFNEFALELSPNLNNTNKNAALATELTILAWI